MESSAFFLWYISRCFHGGHPVCVTHVSISIAYFTVPVCLFWGKSNSSKAETIVAHVTTINFQCSGEADISSDLWHYSTSAFPNFKLKT